MGAVFSLEQAARLYGARLIDYERPGAGLLVSSGCGIMMAVMDQVPAMRWCLDIDSSPGVRLTDFLLMAERCVETIAVCGWFSYTNPASLREAIAALSRPPLVYAGNISMSVGAEVHSLESFIDALQAKRLAKIA